MRSALTPVAPRRVSRHARLVLAVATMIVGRTTISAAQDGALDKVDQLQLVSLIGSAGFIQTSQVVRTNVFGINADYGPISPAWRLDFGIGYWSSRFTDQVVQAFVDTLRRSLVDPTGTAYLQPSAVKLFDVTFDVEFRHMLVPRAWITPFIGGGVSAHVLNAEGPLIQGTFVERSLDAIAAGVFVSAGAQTRIFQRVLLDGMARADLLSGFRSIQLRAGGGYFFGEQKPAKPPQ